MPVLLRRLLATVVVLGALGAIWYGFSAVDRDDGSGDVAVSESSPFQRLIPPRNSEILRQEAVGVELRPGWTGTLVVNDVEIPPDQLDTSNLESLGQILYTVGDGKAVEQFEAGQNCVTAVVWRVEESRADSRPETWCFNVT